MTGDTLSGPERPPQAGGPPGQLVVMLHGVGADGNDLIGLAEPWAERLPKAHFIAPDAPEACDMAPTGRQWFSLQDRSADALLAGVANVAPALNGFIDARLAAFGLSDRQLALVGFSQGTMISLYIAFRRARACAGVLGYSGALVGAERLAAEIVARPPTMLVHGDADEIVPVAATLHAAQVLGGLDAPCQWHISQGVGHGIAPDGLEIGGRFLADAFAA